MNISIQMKKRFPIISILLVISCLISSIPQLILPPLYNFATGQFPSLTSIYLITLPVFTHAPHIFINHLAGNLLVIILFGGLVEIILGSSRFALLTLFTFISTTSLSYFHSLNSGGYTHGASGICFGYIMFFIFFIVIAIENNKMSRNTLLKVIIPILLATFSIVGLPIYEVTILKMGFFENFGQTVHLMSYAMTVPFLILWRKDFEKNSLLILDNRKIEKTNSYKSISIVLLFIILFMNFIATGIVAKKVLEIEQPLCL